MSFSVIMACVCGRLVPVKTIEDLKAILTSADPEHDCVRVRAYRALVAHPDGKSILPLMCPSGAYACDVDMIDIYPISCGADWVDSSPFALVRSLVLLKFMIAADPGIVRRSSANSGMTLLHYAAVGHNKEVIQVLLDAGAEVGATMIMGQTPSQLARMHGYTEAAALIENWTPLARPVPLRRS